ncbi:MAG: hypothetical protein JWO34_213 [Arthrobacter sp.]|nr:hypothetical protein [Arthrobacter sp.]
MDVRLASEFLPTQDSSGSNQVPQPNGIVAAYVVFDYHALQGKPELDQNVLHGGLELITIRCQESLISDLVCCLSIFEAGNCCSLWMVLETRTTPTSPMLRSSSSTTEVSRW